MLIAVLSVILVAIGTIGLLGIRRSNESLKSVSQDRLLPLGYIAEISGLNLRNRLAIAVSLVTPDAATIRQSAAEVETNIAKIDAIWNAYQRTAQTPEERRIAQQFARDRASFVQEGLRPALGALRSGDLEQARRIVLEKIRPLSIPVRAGVEALMKLQFDVAKAEYAAALERYEFIRLVSLATIALGLMFALVFGLFLIRGIVRSLKQAGAVANAVAHGDLCHAIDIRGEDEIAQLLASLLSMQDQLRQVVGEVHRGSAHVAGASIEIARGNHELNVRTESQASALEETAVSMEKFGAALHQNADYARQADRLAQDASLIASQGGDAVAKVVDTMKGINDSSKKIADIIGVIDAIAFQTNILALNAAVEAARAGEQGRGFAVVAAEVRNLAGRSAAAAKEIKTLIGDSVQRVEQGSVLADQAGLTMQEVVSGIRHLTKIVGEISAASSAQSAWVAQVGQAIGQMDQNTQQNALLVQQMALSASDLSAQARDLVAAVAVFKLSDLRTGGYPAALTRIEGSAPDAANLVLMEVEDACGASDVSSNRRAAGRRISA